MFRSASNTSLPASAQSEPKDFYVNILPNEVVILNMNILKRYHLLQPILELTLLNTKSDHFFSLTSTEDELSLVTDSSLLKTLRSADKLVEIEDYNALKDSYRILQFHEGMSGISHTGVVEYLSKLFSKENIPIIYINTYNNNFILVASSDFKKCETILKKHNYVC